MQYEQQNSLHTTLQSRYLDSLLELLPFIFREAIKEGIESMRNVEHEVGTDLPSAINEVYCHLHSHSFVFFLFNPWCPLV